MNMQLPSRLGIMVLPETVLFPHNLLPLYIFEPRYRIMLAEALETHRMFAVALADKQGRPSKTACVGLIRACVQNPDGTSNLMLQGVARVRFNQWEQRTPYYIGSPELVNSSVENQTMVNHLVQRVMQQIDQLKTTHSWVMQDVESFLRDLKDYDMMVDVVAGCFLNDVHAKQGMLECDTLCCRLKRLHNSLNEEYSSKGDGQHVAG